MLSLSIFCCLISSLFLSFKKKTDLWILIFILCQNWRFGFILVFFPGPMTGMLVPLLKNFPAQRTEFWWWKSFWKVSDSRLLKQKWDWWNSYSTVLVLTVIKLIVTLRELSGRIHSLMCVCWCGLLYFQFVLLLY